MKKTLIFAVLMMGCTAVNSNVREEMSKTQCESICSTLGYEIREVRNGDCICNLSSCRHVESGCIPLPPPPDKAK